jgi:hypothetical protein
MAMENTGLSVADEFDACHFFVLLIDIFIVLLFIQFVKRFCKENCKN